MTINSCYPLVLSTDLTASRDFFQVLGFTAVWENDWFVLLQSPDLPQAQLAFMRADHDSLPEPFRSVKPAGVVVTVEVADATAVHERATAAGVEVLQELRDEEFGQRHFLVVDPNGVLVDVVEQTFIPDPGAV